MQIDNSVMVVTGAGSGIGRAMVDAFAAAGARVVAGDLDGAGAEATAAAVRDRGGQAVGMSADAADPAGIDAMIAAAQHYFGDVDAYVANAGIMGPAGLGTDADWDQVLDVNLRAHIRAATTLMPQWVARGRGHFVSVASAAGLLSQLGAAAYAVSKHATVGFAEWLSITYGDNGIGVSCVCPMGVDTPLLHAVRDSADRSAQLAARSITGSGAVLDARQVADLTVQAVTDDRFLVLPHAGVLDMYRQKGADYDRWIAGMRRFQRSLDG